MVAPAAEIIPSAKVLIPPKVCPRPVTKPVNPTPALGMLIVYVLPLPTILKSNPDLPAAIFILPVAPDDENIAWPPIKDMAIPLPATRLMYSKSSEQHATERIWCGEPLGNLTQFTPSNFNRSPATSYAIVSLDASNVWLAEKTIGCV